MADTYALLKQRAFDLIESPTATMSDITYLAKSLADAGLLDETTAKALYDKISALAPTSDARQIAYIIKAMEAGVIYSDEKYKLGTVGTIGFGVATCPDPLLPTGLIGLTGHDVVGSPNYGNYIDANGSVMVYVPRHYYLMTLNDFAFADTVTAGYVIDRSFINGGKEKAGVFVYKYQGTNIGGKFVSKRYTDPCSTNLAHNPISALTGAPANTYGGMHKAVKSAGANYFLSPNYVFTMLARIAYAHGRAAVASGNLAACAYADVAPYMPKGNNNNDLKDVNDPSVVYQPSGYSNCGLTGSASNFSKTTHNGQECGIADLNGNMWEVQSGFTRTTALSFLVLKESVDITAILDDSATVGTGAFDVNLYDAIAIETDGNYLVNAVAKVYFGNLTNTVFDFGTDRALLPYRAASHGVPLLNGISVSGTTQHGNDGFWKNVVNEMMPLRGGGWGDSSDAGAFALHLDSVRTHSGGTVGGRACLYPL